MNKNEIYTIECIEDTYDGFGKCTINQHLVLTKGLLKGEVAKIKILNVKKKVSFAKIEELITPSKYRAIPKCSVANKCGGCQYQYIDYDYQKAMKQKRVKDCLKQIGNLDVEVDDIIASPSIEKYRNKVQIPVQANPFKMGFYRPRTNEIVEFDRCIVQSDVSNALYHSLKKLIKNFKYEEKVRHILIKHALNTNQIMLVLIVRDNKLKSLNMFVKQVLKDYPQVKSIILNINNRNDNVIMGDTEELIYGSKNIQETLGDYIFNISSKSFYQINPYQTVNLYNKAVELANLTKDDLVVDLYCGTGTIGIFLANKAKKVIGIDIVKQAIDDAIENAKLNSIDNIEFICDDATLAIEKIKQEYNNVDVIVVDPPRKGLTEMGINHIMQCEPKRIVYVSCDPATLARDLALLNTQYSIDKVIPVDMFPFTEHVEAIILMTYCGDKAKNEG